MYGKIDRLEPRRLFAILGGIGDIGGTTNGTIITDGGAIVSTGDGGYVGVTNTGNGPYLANDGFSPPRGTSTNPIGGLVIVATNSGSVISVGDDTIGPPRVVHRPKIDGTGTGVGVKIKFDDGRLTITGTNQDDFIRVGLLPGTQSIRVITHESERILKNKARTFKRITIDAKNGNDEIVVDANVRAGAKINGNNGDDTIIGGAGDDFLYGGAGRDDLLGNDGIDRIYGGDGSDTLDGAAGDDILFGEAGDDLFINRSPFQQLNNIVTADSDLVDGGRGTDRAQDDTLDAFARLENDPTLPPIVI